VSLNLKIKPKLVTAIRAEIFFPSKFWAVIIARSGLKLNNFFFRMNTNQDDLLKAVELALAGEWDAAHKLVQQYEDGTAAWIHAVLHKMEGDPGNARYWYRRADRMNHVEDEPRAELAAIQSEVRSKNQF
jgi:hypothetical protein